MSSFIVRENPKKLIRTALLSVLMVAASLMLVVVSKRVAKPINILLFVVGIIGVIFFAASIVMILRRVIKPKPILILSKEGIAFPNATGKAIIPWSQLEGFEQFTMQKQEMIGFHVRDWNQVKQMLSPFWRFSTEISRKLGAPPFSIAMNTLDWDADSLMAVIREQSGLFGGRVVFVNK